MCLYTQNHGNKSMAAQWDEQAVGRGSWGAFGLGGETLFLTNFTNDAFIYKLRCWNTMACNFTQVARQSTVSLTPRLGLTPSARNGPILRQGSRATASLLHTLVPSGWLLPFFHFTEIISCDILFLHSTEPESVSQYLLEAFTKEQSKCSLDRSQ